MLKLLTCAQGHYWETPAENEADASELCPACGQAAESMPLLDLMPSEIAPPAVAEPPPLLPLQDKDGRPVVAGYEILQDLGKGPTGVSLYRARQLLVNRLVVLKVVLARDDPGQLAWGCLRSEAAALGRLVHPNLVQIHEAGQRERQLFYNAVEYVEGPTLAEALDGKPLPCRPALALIETLARALHHAHEKNILHRTLKPASILLPPIADCGLRTPESLAAIRHVKITDFGLARRLVEGDAGDVELQGELPCYLAPEQVWGWAKEIGPATDIYALGAILYELVSGRPPFREATAAETLDAIQCAEPPRLPNVPRDVEAICRKCLHKQPSRRYESAMELAEELHRVSAGYPSAARRISHVERFGKCLRRNVRRVTLVLLSLILAGVLIGLLPNLDLAPFLRRLDRIEEQRYEQEIAQLKAGSLQAQQKETASNYLRDLFLALQSSSAGDREQTRKILERCPRKLRQWEWSYLHGDLDCLVCTAELPITCLDLSRNGLLATGGGSEAAKGSRGGKGEVAVWNLHMKMLQWQVQLGSPVRSLAFRPNNPSLAVVRSSPPPVQNSILQVHYAPTGRQLFPPRQLTRGRLTSVSYSTDGQHLLTIGDDGMLRLLQADTGDQIEQRDIWFRQARPRGMHARLVLMRTTANTDGLALISPDGEQVVLVSDLQSLNPPTELQTPNNTTYLALAYDPNSERLAVAGVDRTIRLMNARSPYQEIMVLRGHKGSVRGVTFGSKGKRLASCSEDGTVYIWDVEQGLILLTLRGYDNASAIRFALTDGETERLAIAHGNKVTVWQPK